MEKPARMHHKRRNRANSRALFSSSIYMAVGVLWIFLSDAAVVAMYPDFENQVVLQFVKGLFFILVTACTFYVVVYRLVVKQEELREKLAERHAERDMLLREMHHRIKNNLQFVISMLGIQRNTSRSSDVYDALGSSQARIRSLALANSALYRDALSLKRAGTRSMTPVLEELVRTYEPFIALGGGKLEIRIDLGPVPLSDELLVPVSLGMGEVLSLVMQILEKNITGNSLFTLNIFRQQDAVAVELLHDGLTGFGPLPVDSVELLSGLAAQSSGSVSVPDDDTDRLLVTFGSSEKP